MNNRLREHKSTSGAFSYAHIHITDWSKDILSGCSPNPELACRV